MASFSDLAGIVELAETRGRTLRRVKAQMRRTGIVRFLDVLAFRAYYRLAHAAADRHFEHTLTADVQRRFGPAPAAVPVLRARSVNAAETIEFLRACRPDFVIARCKTLLNPAVFQVPARGTYVLHPGICPEYRNAHGCFWALASRDLARVGLTLLKIDKGVDTGPVYGYFTYQFDERTETHVRIQQRVLTDNLDAVRDRLLDTVSGLAPAIDTSRRASKTWGQPWLTAFARWKWAARRQAEDAHAGAALP